MDLEEFAEKFFRFACPFLMFLSPIALVLTYRAPNPPEDHMGTMFYIGISLFFVTTTVLSFLYCRNKMGWFGGKKK